MEGTRGCGRQSVTLSDWKNNDMKHQQRKPHHACVHGRHQPCERVFYQPWKEKTEHDKFTDF